MTISLQHTDFRIEVFDDPAFTLSADSPSSYDKIIQTEDDKPYSSTSQHAIKIYQGDNLVRTAILLASSGATGIVKGAALIDQDNLIIRCSNKLFSLSLPELNTNWVIEPDMATCFSVHQYKDSYITHGEMDIARVSRTGNLLWTYSGADIFVCLYEGNPFEMHEDFIEMTDFNGGKYQIDYSGKTLKYEQSEYDKQEPVTVYLKSKRPWWKFW